MLSLIDRDVWPGWKPMQQWGKISDSAKELVKLMMNPKVSERPSVNKCLEHPWLTGNASNDDLGDIKEALKSYQAKKKLKGAILGVMATNRMKTGLLAMLQNANVNETNTTTTPQSTPIVNVSQPSNSSMSKISHPFKSLNIHVLQGRELYAKDKNGKSDPYCQIWVGPNKFKTKVKAKTLNPQWEKEDYTVSSEKCGKSPAVILLECWDENVVLKDEFMGEFVVKIDDIPMGESQNWYKLNPSKDRKKKGSVSGEILLMFNKV